MHCKGCLQAGRLNRFSDPTDVAPQRNGGLLNEDHVDASIGLTSVFRPDVHLSNVHVLGPVYLAPVFLGACLPWRLSSRACRLNRAKNPRHGVAVIPAPKDQGSPATHSRGYVATDLNRSSGGPIRWPHSRVNRAAVLVFAPLAPQALIIAY